MDKYLQIVINFFKKLFSDSTDVGSKRVVGFGSFCLFAAMVIVHLVTKQTIQGELIIAVVTIISACFALNAAISMKQISANSKVTGDVTSDVPDDDADATPIVVTTDDPVAK